MVRAIVLLLVPGAMAFTPSFHTATSARGLASAQLRRGRPLAQSTLQSAARPKPQLAPEDQWIGKLDLDGFRDEIRDLGRRLEKGQGEDDVKHIKKICLMANTCAFVGLTTMFLPANPITVMALSLWTFSRWTTIAHHTCHGGYNKADETRFFNSKGFALGFKARVTQWFDWMLPEAWNVEHNNLHHYRLGEVDDPDLVERNLQFVRDLKVPTFFKYGAVGFLMCTWKWFYYAPNTYKELVIAEMRRNGEVITEEMGPKEAFTLKYFLEPNHGAKSRKWYRFRDFFAKVMGPYLLGHFVLLPLPMLALGAALGGSPGVGVEWFRNSVVSLLLADVVTNIHSFIAIATNHAGKDLYQFGSSCAPNSGTFYLRQVVSSANFRTGGDLNDFMHGWLNYQVEHHLWPQLSALSYQRSQPEVAAICAKYGVPYVQESVWIRLKKTVDIMVGKESMRVFPQEFEADKDRMVWNDQKEMENAAKCIDNTPPEAEKLVSA
eukprot:CAMPEP_0172613370 /NCGR_PEP_ID=MMETSP1068-20121228/42050_1 /TAXON_ID=35684 /ORGANISM="Pseudopedinella elastica, Strain CCMP716" /LENGTH=491 /DNA_ID=CAMNT_0013417801 /DNA_START=137 /DNA_END=1612 /DNA_ORIENTATION=+